MRQAAAILLIAAIAGSSVALAQTRRTTPRRPAAPATKPRVEPAMMACTMVLGEGVQTKRQFCDVPIGRDAASGILITLPPHTGPVSLSFDLHNRHTYSESEVKSNRAYHRYMATIGVMTADNTLLTRAVVQNEFRTAADLVDRISAGPGGSGVKAVAPSGSESIVVTIPPEESTVSIVGEKLSVIRVDGVDTFSAPGRPMAVISNVMVEYRPAPARRTPTPTRRK